MKKNELRNQDKNKINKIDQNQIMNLLIIKTINYKNKNKNKNLTMLSKLKLSNSNSTTKIRIKIRQNSRNQMKHQIILIKKNSCTLIVIIIKNDIYNHASTSILNLQKKNDKKSIKLR